MGLVEAALEGAKLRFRPILVIGGILAATFIAVFLVPVLFYFVEKFIGKRKSEGGRVKTRGLRPAAFALILSPQTARDLADRTGASGAVNAECNREVRHRASPGRSAASVSRAFVLR